MTQRLDNPRLKNGLKNTDDEAAPKQIRGGVAYSKNREFSAYFTHLNLQPTNLRNGRRRVYRLLKDFRVEIVYPGGKDVIVVPGGFPSDLASIPILCQLVLGNRDDYLEESIIHDWLCSKNQPRFFTNSKMRVIMSVLRRKRWKQILVFYGLMFLGYGSFVFNLFTGRSNDASGSK